MVTYRAFISLPYEMRHISISAVPNGRIEDPHLHLFTAQLTRPQAIIGDEVWGLKILSAEEETFRIKMAAGEWENFVRMTIGAARLHLRIDWQTANFTPMQLFKI